jgi:glycosyltransferase involved in cell wall biosynthesis
MAPLRVVHLISGLEIGGAEMMLYRLLATMDRSEFSSQVVSLTDIGPVGEMISALGIPVWAVRMGRGIPNPLATIKLSRWLRRKRPHVIQTWMYHADLVGGMAALLAGGVPVAWGIHHSNLDPRWNKRMTIWTASVCAKLSKRLPDKIVCCSQAARRVHTCLGYAEEKMVVIPNGFDLEAFKPDETARCAVRHELGIPDSALLIGMVARFHPQKDHHNFIEAAARLHQRVSDVHFLLCGEGVSSDNAKLTQWIEAAGGRENFHLLGKREDIPRLLAALDIASSSSSYGEAFPLVIGEAMACGVPCVVTDVGDSALIVGDTGIVVPPRDPSALAAAWHELIRRGEEERRRLGKAARRRIQANYSLPGIAARYERLYREIAQKHNI